MKKTYILKAVAFILIVGMLLSYAGDVLLLKKVTPDDTANTYIQKGIYDLENNTIEVCFLGNSQLVYGVSSTHMLENYGISAYSASTSLQPFFLNLFNLKEIRKTQDIKTVVLDMGAIDRNTRDERNRMVLDNAPLSLNKLEYIWEYCRNDPEANDIWTYIFPIMKYHGRWNALDNYDFEYKNTNTHVFRGNIFSCDIFPISPEYIITDDGEPVDPASPFDESQVKYFRELVEYCIENKLELILIKTPKFDWNATLSAYTQALAEEYDLEFLDFNTSALLEATGISMDTDFKDKDHLNTYGMEKLTNYLAEYLLSNGEYTDFRETDHYANEPIEAYHKDLNRNLVKLARTPEEALDVIATDEEYDVLMQKTGEISDYWNDDIQKAFEKLGLETDISDLTNINFVAHLSGGKSVYEASDIIAVKYKATDSEGNTIMTLNGNHLVLDELTNTVTPAENVTGLPVGLNITVYDNTYDEVVRTFTIYGDPATNSLVIY